MLQLLLKVSLPVMPIEALENCSTCHLWCFRKLLNPLDHVSSPGPSGGESRM